MQLQTVNRTDAEKIFGSFTNVAGATITTGQAVCMTNLVASLDGNQAVQPATGVLHLFMGLTVADVADNAVGRYQCYGYNGSVFYFSEATSVSLAVGQHVFGPGNASLGVGATGLSTYPAGCVMMLASIGAVVRSGTGYTQGFIRAM